MLGRCTGVKAAIPNCDYEVGHTESQGAGQVDGIGTAQTVSLGQTASGQLHAFGELHRAYRSPELLPVLLTPLEAGFV